MPRGFYVARSLAVRAIELLDAQTAQGSGFRFHPSVRNQKLSIYEPNPDITLPAMLRVVDAWARFNTDFFRPGRLPVGDDMVVLSDDSGLVCYIGLVHRIIMDHGGTRMERTVYNHILWALDGWPTGFFASVQAANIPKETKFRSDAVKFAGATIVTTATLQERIASGAAGHDPDGITWAGTNPLWNPMNTMFGGAGLNPLFGGKGH
jgi:hypothetical protein